MRRVSLPSRVRRLALCVLAVLTIAAPVTTPARSAGAGARPTRLQPAPSTPPTPSVAPVVSPVAAARQDEADKTSGKLDPERSAILLDLYKQYTNGAPFSDEEVIVLNHFVADLPVSELEADTVISRALYAEFISHAPLTREQADLFDRYSAMATQRVHDIADLKRQIQERAAAEWAANPRAPQV